LKVAPSSTTRPVVIFFPPADGNAALLYTLYAHELGHSVVLQHNLLNRVLATKLGSSPFDGDFASAVAALATARHVDLSTAHLALDRQMRKWLVELLCDSVATHFAGPGYALAFAAVVVAEGAGELQESHPPTVTRLRLILEDLDASGWLDVLRSRSPSVTKWLEHMAQQPTGATLAHETFLVQAMHDFSSEIRSLVKAQLGARHYVPTDFAPQDVEIEDLLQNRILPAQLQDGTAADRRTF
jgi:hypothetical protein